MKTLKELKIKRDELQEQIDNFTPPEFIVGSWYEKEGTDFMVCYQGKGKTHYGFNMEGRWSYCIGNAGFKNSPEEYVPLSSWCVEEALLNESKLRGLVEGVYITSPWMIGRSDRTIGKVIKINGRLMATKPSEEYTIYENGRWADVDEPPVAMYGYEMKDDGDSIRFGCKDFYKSEVRRLDKLVKELNITRFTLEGGYEVEAGELSYIANKIKK